MFGRHESLLSTLLLQLGGGLVVQLLVAWLHGGHRAHAQASVSLRELVHLQIGRPL